MSTSTLPTKAWTRLFGSSSRDEAHALTTGLDGAIYVAGATQRILDGQTINGSVDANTIYDVHPAGAQLDCKSGAMLTLGGDPSTIKQPRHQSVGVPALNHDRNALQGTAMQNRFKLDAVAVTTLVMASAHAQEDTPLYQFFWSREINMAPQVINTDEGCLDKNNALKSAAAIAKVPEDAAKLGTRRPIRVTASEPLLIREAGDDITVLHAERLSREVHDLPLGYHAQQLSRTRRSPLQGVGFPRQAGRGANANCVTEAYQWGAGATQQLWASVAALC
jgi:hypothetical protein